MPFFTTCGPNEAMVISGCCHGRPYIVPGGRAFVWPYIQRLQKLSLNTMTLKVESPLVYTRLGVALAVTGIAQVKVEGSNPEMLSVACQQFLGKSEGAIRHIALETLEGHQRAIMGYMTVEEIYQDRKAFSKHVFDVASSDLLNMGIVVISYTLKDIHDSEGYLHALGESRTAEVKRDARMGEAEALRDAGIKQSLAEQDKMKATYQNNYEKAKAQRDYEIQKAMYDTQVQLQQAQADLAYELQAAKQKQKIKEEEMKILEVERTQNILVQEQEVQRKSRSLDAQIKQPAAAEKYKKEKLAEAKASQVKMEAEAEAETLRLKGEAEAFATKALAKAEAEQMRQKADAWKEYKDAAVVDMILDTLPKVVAEVAAPLSKVNSMKLVSTGGSVGALQVSGEVLQIVERLPAVVTSMTGIDMSKSTAAAKR